MERVRIRLGGRTRSLQGSRTLPETDCNVQSPLQRPDEELSRQEDWKVKVPKF